MQCIGFGISLAVILALATTAYAQEEVEKLLVPIEPARVVGAFGSEWVTDLAITNMSSTRFSVTRDVDPLCVVQCHLQPLPAGATAFVHSLSQAPSLGGFLFVERGRSADLAVTLRSRDVSRQGETWGTSIPVVRENELFSRKFGLVDIPTESQFRSTLRIYDADAETHPRVRVRVYKLTPERDPVSDAHADAFLLEFEPTFVLPAAGERKLAPASAEIALWLDPVLTSANRVRIEIEPLDGRTDYWGFVSTTHNATQHVTLVTP